ncbi:MAG: redoxin domain-containing protein [Pseudobutyrivibrio sp.]|nr:redoxin domain-containing protein [Pseudobutyrivibrio sp.]
MSIVSVFIEGLLSFFSPCVLPLIPVYIGYLSGGTLKTTGDGQMVYDRKKVVINTIFFVIGISMAFFVLGFGISAVGRFFSGYQMIFARAGGIIIVLFGLYQLGFLGTNRILSGDYRLPVQFEKMTMSPITAILMGFVISFAWTPCIGPVLSSVLIMAATAGTSANGFGLIAVYTLGYIIPFILVGFFTNTLLNFFSKHKGVVKYTVKIGGVILIVMGLMMFTGKMNSITSYLSSVSGSNVASEATVEEKSDVVEIPDETVEEDDVVGEEPDAEEAATEKIAAPDFTLTDQYGNTHSLSDYKGKIIFLNFWATWCPPCRAEMPDIQALYEEYQKMDDPDVVILGVAFPNYGKEQSVEGITQFLDENGYTYPVLMDTEASLVLPYYITAYPTTFMIDPDGNVLGYLPGGMTRDIMENVIEQAREASYK